MYIRRKLRITGRVQGVGFRPYASVLADELGLSGSVINSQSSVVLDVSGTRKAVDEMLRRLFENEAALITGMEVIFEDELSGRPTGGFVIGDSGTDNDDVMFIPADIATCPDCEAALFDESDRRFFHPFISCAVCGPRFSIMEALPYDRDNTVMSGFGMCELCRREYTRLRDRRRHAQTICCNNCGPVLYAVRPGGNDKKTGRAAIECAVSVLKDGGIIAVKDIGGYHFAFRADSRAASDRLRAIKHRDEKPFAVLFSDMKSIRHMAFVSETESRLLQSCVRPIVLLKKREAYTAIDHCLGDSTRIGAMLPGNPIQLLLADGISPLVMTSANMSGEPMITSDEKIMETSLGSDGIDLILFHNRSILRGLDDSIYQVTAVNGKDHIQILRRARGIVPEPVMINGRLKEDSFAAGGDLKSVFALGRGRAVYLSGHYGDLDNVSANKARDHDISDYKSMLGIAPDVAVTDRHPGYISSKAGEKRIIKIQHHHAHILSVIAEHGLRGNVLGVAFDGTGYGDDKTIWGGEFLMCRDRDYFRKGHLKAVDMIAGDVSAKDCDSAAFSFLYAYDPKLAEEFAAEAKNTVRFEIQRKALKNRINTVAAGSMGRLFDAVSAVLDAAHHNNYEGQAPMRLQAAAESYIRHDPFKLNAPDLEFEIVELHDGTLCVDSPKMISEIFKRKRQGERADALAYAFHAAAAKMTAEMCERICRDHFDGCSQIALSGGTMANSLFLEELLPKLDKAGLEYYLNEKVPCGDGGLALGQIYYLSEEI